MRIRDWSSDVRSSDLALMIDAHEGCEIAACDYRVMPPRRSQQESGIGRTNAPFRPDQNTHDPGVGELPPCLTHQQSRVIVNDVGVFYRHEAPEQIILGLARSCNFHIRSEEHTTEPQSL